MINTIRLLIVLLTVLFAALKLMSPTFDWTWFQVFTPVLCWIAFEIVVSIALILFAVVLGVIAGVVGRR